MAFYTASKTGKTGLTVTIDIYDPSGTQIVTGGSATAIGGGLYAYTLSTNNSAEGEYAAIFKTTDSTVDAQHIPSLWVLGRAGVENLDASVSSRSTLTAAQVNTEADTAISDVGLTSTITGRIDQAISTRLAAADYTAPSAAPTVAAIRTEMDSNSTKLANLDATVSSRLASSAYSAAPTTAQIATAVEGSLLNEADGQTVLAAIVGAIGNTNLSEVSLVAAVRADLERNGGKLDSIPTTAAPSASAVASATRTELSTELSRIDQAISSRLASSSYTAPANSDIAAVKAKTDNLPASPAATGDIPSANITAIKAKTDLLNTDRLANVATTNIVGTLLAQANS